MTTMPGTEATASQAEGPTLTGVGRRPKNGEAMSQRTFRSTDAAWNAAKEAAEANGEELSDELRKFLDRYAKKKPRPQQPPTS